MVATVTKKKTGKTAGRRGAIRVRSPEGVGFVLAADPAGIKALAELFNMEYQMRGYSVAQLAGLSELSEPTVARYVGAWHCKPLTRYMHFRSVINLLRAFGYSAKLVKSKE